MPQKRYLIVGYSRTGTTALHLAVMGHPDVSALDGELRPSPFFDRGLAALTGGHLAPEEAERGHQVLFDAATGIRNPSAYAFGAKTACNFNGESIVRTIRTHLPGLFVIHVRRRDTIAHFASSESARRSGVYHSWQRKGGSEGEPRLRLSRWPLLRFERGVRLLDDDLAKVAQSNPYLVIDYEAFCGSPDETYQRIFAFLGLRDMPVTWQTSRKILADARRIVLNYDQCEGWLAGKDRPMVRSIVRLYAGLRSKKLRHPFRYLKEMQVGTPAAKDP